MMSGTIPVSVLIVTRREAPRIERCLRALSDFSEIIVIDSNSDDDTSVLAQPLCTRVENFTWNGQYPKKRQWCLDNLHLRHDWVLFVDADEIVPQALVDEIAQLFAAGEPTCAGYFIKGRYVMEGRSLRFGLQNNKLALFDRRALMFPVLDDLAIPGMGEIEGHYQPVFRSGVTQRKLGVLKRPLLHYAYDNPEGWQRRHERYAQWEAGMNRHKAWPNDPVVWRQLLKGLYRALPCRGMIAFTHSYIVKSGWRDGARGFRLARDRYHYYKLIARKKI